MHSTRARTGGFTLLEIMIALAIAAIVLAMGVPAMFKGMQKEGLRKAVSDIVEACSHARAFAILQGVPMEVVIRAEDGRISVEQAREAVAQDPKEEQFLDEKPARTITKPDFQSRLDDDIIVKLLHVNFVDQMEFPETRVRFFPNGTSDEFAIILLSNDGERMVTLDVVTGLAEVQTIR